MAYVTFMPHPENNEKVAVHKEKEEEMESSFFSNVEAYFEQQISLFTQLVAEFVGTFTFVFIGCGAECVSLYLLQQPPKSEDDFFNNNNNNNLLLLKALLWMIGGILGIYVSATTSGGHINPAVSLSFALVRPTAFPRYKVIPYWIAQLLGAMLAGVINLLLFYHAIENFEQNIFSSGNNNNNNNYCIQQRHENGNKKRFSIKKSSSSEQCIMQGYYSIQSASAFGNFWSLSGAVIDQYHACFIEAIGTAFIVMIIFSITNPMYIIPSTAVPPIVGLSIGAMSAILSPLTGAGMNPARDVGLRLVTFATHWGNSSMVEVMPYIVGPLIGGPIGASLADTIMTVLQ